MGKHYRLGALILSAGLAACGSSDDTAFTAAPDAGGGSGGSGATGGSAGSGATAGTGGAAGAGGSSASGGSAGSGATGGIATGGSAGSGATGGSGGSGGGVCGNGTIEPTNGEQCDDGGTAPGDGCDAQCQYEPVGQTCGDTNVDALEVCDDGNLQNGDACNPTCNFGNTTTLFAGSPGNAGNTDGVGTNARFGGFGNLTSDNDNLWLADGGNRVIRRIEIATATVTTIAGDGTQGYQDDANGLNAKFGSVEAITTDGNTLWIADAANKRVRAVSLTPPYAVTTLAGNGNTGVTDGPAGTGEFDGIRGLTYYNGYIYMVDGTAALLRRIDASTGELVTLAGSAYQTGSVDGVGSAARFISPRYMASDNKGTLYVADTNGNEIRTFDVASNAVGSFAGDGTQGYVDGVGASARIHRPRGMTSDGTSIYFVEFNQHTIRQGVQATASISTMVGQHCGGTANCAGGYSEGVGTQAQLDSPFSITYHYASGSLFFLDGGNNVIRRIQ